MRKYGVATGVLLTAVLGLTSGSNVEAKPSDLPAQNQVQCPECVEKETQGSFLLGIDFLTGRITLKVETASSKMETPSIDAICPSLLPVCLDRVLQQAGDWVVAHAAPQTVADPGEKQARDLFKTAESCRRNGDLFRARTCYQQVHMLTPTSNFGRLAIERLVEVEAKMRDSFEESEVPEPGPGLDQSSRGIKPLGLVELSY